ncbi:MAG: pyridoxamine kinase [Lachnospiraceae bacterium]|nr:pyridoxamine kinase [Lachnospiraceae bacterium]
MIKNVAVFNDLSGFGKCSLTAAIPVISVLGSTPHPIATEVLTGQGGYPVFYSRDLTDMLPEYIKAWKANNASFEAIYSGYLTGVKQIEYVFEFIQEFKKKDTFILIDPIMGDNGKVYRIFSNELLNQMRELTREAHLITPNLTEACLLAGVDYNEIVTIKDSTELIERVKNIGHNIRNTAKVKQDVIITGIKHKQEDRAFIYNVAITEQGCEYYRSHLFERSFSGTGDLFASAMCGLKLAGHSTIEGMNIASDFLYHSIADTMNSNTLGNDGVEFETHLTELLRGVGKDERRNK